MRPMMRLVLGLAVLVGIMAGVAFGLPAHVTVTRSQSINAPESVVFPYLNNLHQFSEWSPWQLRDPQLKVSYGGAEQGKGAQVQWTSQKPSVGTGSMEIVESEPNRSIDLAVNFNGLDGTGSYKIVPDGSGSKVTWSFGYESGSSPLKRWKALMLDGFIGADYIAGLERLKQKIETERRPGAPTLAPGGAPGQSDAALPPGSVPKQSGTAPRESALPPGQAAPGGTVQPGTGPTSTATPDATQPDASAPAAAEATPPAPTAPAPKQKKPKPQRRQ
jgi:Polyketide cyclase / dehydrase and lipid transport